MNNSLCQESKCVVIGRNYCNILTIVRALGRAGYYSKVLRIFKKKPNKFNPLNSINADSYSKYVKAYEECIVNNDYQKMVNHLIEISDSSNKLLLLPVDDFTVFVVDEYYDVLSNYYFIPNISELNGKITELMNKDKQKALASKLGLSTLHSSLIIIKNGQYEIPHDIKYPCFIKPNISMKTNKSIMRECKNREILEETLSNLSTTDELEILAEEYVDIKNEFSLLGISTKETVIAPGFFKVIAGGHKERKGVTIVGEIEKCSDYKEIIEKCCQYVKSIHYVGLFDIDLVETKQGQFYFFELNFRSGASVHAITEMGVNLPGMLADYYLKGYPVPKNVEIRQYGQRFVSEKVLLEELVRSDICIEKAMKYIKDSDIHFIKDEKDIEPFNHFKRYYVLGVLLRLPYKLRDIIKNKI